MLHCTACSARLHKSTGFKSCSLQIWTSIETSKRGNLNRILNPNVPTYLPTYELMSVSMYQHQVHVNVPIQQCVYLLHVISTCHRYSHIELFSEFKLPTLTTTIQLIKHVHVSSLFSRIPEAILCFQNVSDHYLLTVIFNRPTN